MKLNFRLLLLAGIVITAFSCDKVEKSTDLKVKTKPISSLTAFSAMTGGSIVGSAPISERGVCWGTNEEPTKDDGFLLDIDPIEGEFISKISKLEPLTNYFVRAYAITTSGETIYGDALNLTTTSFEVVSESNSYMVDPDNVIVFPVSRANKSLLGEQIKSSDVLVAELLWMDNVDVVDLVFVHGSGATGNLVVITGNVEGNAVVTVKVNNIIKWSWHIWVTKNAKKMGTITVPKGVKLMDRNLGATTKLTGEIGAVGVQYQFGRKDPFTASSTFVPLSDEVLLYDLNNNHPFIENALGPRNFAFATANPLTFIVMADLIDWCDVDVRTWWINENGTKTIYDPCPQGWRVPAIEDFEGIIDEHVDKAIADGHNFIYNGQSNYWPFSGYREVGGIMEANAVVGTFWCNLPIPGGAGIGASFSPSYGMGGTQAMNGSPRARGLSIRCIKE